MRYLGRMFNVTRLFLFPVLLSSRQHSRTLTRNISLWISVSNRVYSKHTTMPKKDKTSKSTQKAADSPSCPVTKLKDGTIGIAVHAKPGAKQNAVTDVSEEAVGVAIAAPPSDGEANAELLRYLSKVLQLKKSEVVLDKGSKSQEKVVKVTAAVSIEDILHRLRTEADS
ncbi:hypothetical protein DNTS_015248 [Danionella cerebrum]|uniref:Uncharacterized protein n=1 Tax=Danionella cerebrum TaxID=2873325 RepID=A0A553MSF5_9TELE|nr:hypothetical protein DNTS_015248 [Danionella translucida]